ncbi:MAG TPA: response regulator [Pseudomonadales bacterium]|nr:response regulator [Pseudomonadales bacterium]
MAPARVLRILVVDDEADLVATYCRLFRRQGYDVESAGTRAGGLALIESASPDLVIADLELPDGDGLDLVRAACAAPVPSRAIVVSGVLASGVREDAMAAGASAFVAKPFSLGALGDLVRSLLEATAGR